MSASAQLPPPARPAEAPRRATVGQVLAGRVPVGRVVRVAGRCLGYGGPAATQAAADPPPRTRSDWLLADGARAVYVVGAFPPGCQPMTGGPERVTLLARVAADTLSGLAGPGPLRHYLVRAGAVSPP